MNGGPAAGTGPAHEIAMVSYALPCPRGSAVGTRSHERCCYRTLKGQTLEGPLIRVSRAVDPFIPIH